MIKESQASTNTKIKMERVLAETAFKNRMLSAVTQAGLVNNLNDGMIWGLFPVFLSGLSYSHDSIGLITGTYPAVWGIGQLFTGRMADFYSKKKMLFYGMLLQGLVIIVIPYSNSFLLLVALAAALGLGTALVYPTFLTAIAQATHPEQRAESIGSFRLFRDLGYPIGALFSGIIADGLGVTYAILMVGVLTLTSALIIRFRM